MPVAAEKLAVQHHGLEALPVCLVLRECRFSAGKRVEADETFIGGKARNMHVSESKRRITGTGSNRRENPRQDSRFKTKRYVDGWQSASRI